MLNRFASGVCLKHDDDASASRPRDVDVDSAGREGPMLERRWKSLSAVHGAGARWS